MKSLVSILLLLMLLFTACARQESRLNSYQEGLIQPSDQTHQATEKSDSSETNDFEAFGQEKMDYSISEKQIVHIGDTIEGVNLMDFSSGNSDFVSQADVTLNSVERISDIDSISGNLVANEYDKSKNCDWILLSMTIENTGAVKADFMISGSVWSVPQNTMTALTDDDHYWAALAYIDNGDVRSISGDLLTLNSGENVTLTVACPVSLNAPNDNEVLYWELNPHADSFFYKNGRQEVWFVEIDL